MTFKPYPVMTVFSLLALGLLLWLGNWQLERMAWKQDQTDAWLALQAREPVSLDQAYCGRANPFSWRVERPEFVLGSIVQIYGRDPSGAPGWRIFQPAPVGECASEIYVLVETGFLQLSAPLMSVIHEGPMRLERPLAEGAFTPERDPETLQFYSFDAEAIESVLQLEPGSVWPQGWLVTDTGALPDRLSQTTPADHLGYALTWFGLALALLGVYLFFHYRAGRLKFTGLKD